MEKRTDFGIFYSGGVGATYVGPSVVFQSDDAPTDYRHTGRLAESNIQFNAQVALGYTFQRWFARANFSKGLGWRRDGEGEDDFLLDPLDRISLSVGYTIGGR